MILLILIHVTLTDLTIDMTDLSLTIDSLDSLNGGATSLIKLFSGATINVDAGEITICF